MGKPDAHDVLVELALAIRVPLANQVERGRNDLALELRKGGFGSATPATTTAAPLLLGLAIRPLKGPHVEEVDIAGDDACCAPRPVVANHRVVGNEVARLELPLLQEEGVPRHDLRERGAACLEYGHSVLWATVHRVDESDVPDPVVVVCAHLEEHLLDGRRRHVPPGAGELNRRRLILQDVDVVFGRRRNERAILASEFDGIEVIGPYRDPHRQTAVGVHGEFVGSHPVQHESAAGGQHRGFDAELHNGALERGDISSVGHRSWLQAGVRREVIRQVQLIHVGEIRHVDGEGG